MSLNNIIGATLIVAGTTIGAGMLGLPMVAVKFGILKSIFFLCFMWMVMCYSALLQAKVLCNTPGAMSIASLAYAHLGTWARIVGGICLLILFYALLTAYLSGASSIISNFEIVKIEPHQIALIITAFMIALFSAKIKLIDMTNRLIFIVKLGALIAVLITLSNIVETKDINKLPKLDDAHVATAVLIFFISFGFHGSIPALVKYLNHHYPSIRKSLIIGSSIPLVLFIFWTVLSLLAVYSSNDAIQAEFFQNTDNLNAFHRLLTFHGSKWHHIVLNLFMLGAILTSYLGVAIGLLEYIREYEIIKNKKYNQQFSAILTIGIPFVFVLTIGQTFIKALSLGAAMLAFIAVIIPSLVALKTRTRNAMLTFHTNQVFICLNLLFGLSILVIELIMLLS